jgi:hypothetical protein
MNDQGIFVLLFIRDPPWLVVAFVEALSGVRHQITEPGQNGSEFKPQYRGVESSHIIRPATACKSPVYLASINFRCMPLEADRLKLAALDPLINTRLLSL